MTGYKGLYPNVVEQICKILLYLEAFEAVTTWFTVIL